MLSSQTFMLMDFARYFPTFVASTETDEPFPRQFRSPFVHLHFRRDWQEIDGEHHVFLNITAIDLLKRPKSTFAAILAHLQANSPWNGIKIEANFNRDIESHVWELSQQDPRWNLEDEHDSYWLGNPTGEFTAQYYGGMLSRLDRHAMERESEQQNAGARSWVMGGVGSRREAVV